MRFDLGQEDFLANKVITPGWYDVVIHKVQDELAKDGVSMNCVVDYKITEGPSEGTSVRVWYNEKAKWAITDLAAVFGVKYDPANPKATKPFDPAPYAGKKLKIYVKNEERNSRMQNTVTGYRPTA